MFEEIHDIHPKDEGALDNPLPEPVPGRREKMEFPITDSAEWNDGKGSASEDAQKDPDPAHPVSEDPPEEREVIICWGTADPEGAPVPMRSSSMREECRRKEQEALPLPEEESEEASAQEDPWSPADSGDAPEDDFERAETPGDDYDYPVDESDDFDI